MSIAMNQNNNTTQQFKVQLMSLRMQTEILEGDSFMTLRPVQIPRPAVHENPSQISDTKLAFLNIANAPLVKLDDSEEHASFYESEPEILLTDSDEEEMEEVTHDAEVDTAIGSSDENCTMSDSDVDGDVFEEFSPRALPSVQASFQPQSLSDVTVNQMKARLANKNLDFKVNFPGNLSKAYAEDQ